MINVILCGGSGTRLWPLSRQKLPKQFIRLFDDHSLFQKTVLRNAALAESYLIICHVEHYFLAKDQFDALSLSQEATYLLESAGRNTAPAMALASLYLGRSEEVVLVTPSDHMIYGEDDYRDSVINAAVLAKDNFLVTFGIKPDRPETGYGYIQHKGQNVVMFHEKPSLKEAEKYFVSPDFLWNSGMFCFTTDTFLSEMETHAPEVIEKAQVALERAEQGSVMRVSAEDMKMIPAISVDVAVMEKSTRLKVLEAVFNWSDLGSFDSLALFSDSLLSSHNIQHNGVQLNSSGNFVLSNRKRVVLIDADDLIVVDTPDNLLISKRNSSYKVRKVVESLQKTDPDSIIEHWKGNRPWGEFHVLEEDRGYKIKKIIVKPQKKLSLQKHKLRSEHWVVVQGTALVTVGEDKRKIKVNESTFIPIGEVHRLENLSDTRDLIIIEVQVGKYTGEDDIIRLEDDFKRFNP